MTGRVFSFSDTRHGREDLDGVAVSVVTSLASPTILRRCITLSVAERDGDVAWNTSASRSCVEYKHNHNKKVS